MEFALLSYSDSVHKNNEINEAAPNSFLWKTLKLIYPYRIAA